MEMKRQIFKMLTDQQLIAMRTDIEKGQLSLEHLADRLPPTRLAERMRDMATDLEMVNAEIAARDIKDCA